MFYVNALSQCTGGETLARYCAALVNVSCSTLTPLNCIRAARNINAMLRAYSMLNGRFVSLIPGNKMQIDELYYFNVYEIVSAREQSRAFELEICGGDSCLCDLLKNAHKEFGGMLVSRLEECRLKDSGLHVGS